mmetsp:Transcript_57245/g.165901  ORF Transcript_57245/g.165901 Transcript_57245/m.165901 type:complete len:201 (-) Transcript_57245:703-1305(-)
MRYPTNQTRRAPGPQFRPIWRTEPKRHRLQSARSSSSSASTTRSSPCSDTCLRASAAASLTPACGSLRPASKTLTDAASPTRATFPRDWAAASRTKGKLSDMPACSPPLNTLRSARVASRSPRAASEPRATTAACRTPLSASATQGATAATLSRSPRGAARAKASMQARRTSQHSLESRTHARSTLASSCAPPVPAPAST